MSNELPPLPHPVTNALMGDDFEDLYTSDQMREYGRACERAAYERIAQMLEQVESSYHYDARELAAFVREEIEADK